MAEIDDTDRALISMLGQNARLPVATLAGKLGMARTTVQARIERLERSGVIAGYSVRLGDRAAAGMIRSTVLIQLKPSAQGAVLAQLKRLPDVESAHTTSGRFDLCCELRSTSTLQLDETLDKIGEIDGVEGLESLIHLSTRIDRRL